MLGLNRVADVRGMDQTRGRTTVSERPQLCHGFRDSVQVRLTIPATSKESGFLGQQTEDLRLDALQYLYVCMCFTEWILELYVFSWGTITLQKALRGHSKTVLQLLPSLLVSPF